MATFAIGIILLVVGAIIYGRFIEKVFMPDNRKTPALASADGVDFVEMPAWKNSLIELLNIAGTGPILGPIQGILFGPIAFIAIPIGNVFAGAVHDYLNGMISMRNNGAQMPRLVNNYLGDKSHKVYLVIIMILMVLTGVVFVYTPGDLIVGLAGGDASPKHLMIWIVYGLIFLYYLCATLFPIDKIIGRIYPIFGAILLISAVGVFFGVLMDGGKHLTNIWEAVPTYLKPADGAPFIPVFFITVACGIMSGFHGSQSTLVSRTIRSEKEGRHTFYYMMILEGFIAMCWAAGAMVLYNSNPQLVTGATATKMVSIVSVKFLGGIGGVLAIIGVIILPITSGDTAFRSVRLMIAEAGKIDQRPALNRIKITLAIFVPAILILVFAKTNANGFNLLWRYFGFTNQLVACFALAMSTSYLIAHNKNYWLTLIPMIFYTFIVTSFICHAEIGLSLEGRILGQHSTYTISYVIGVIVALVSAFFTVRYAKNKKERSLSLEPKAIF